MMAANPTKLTDDLVIEAGGWTPAYARVLLIETHRDVAIALVDGNGDGAELEMEYWFRGDHGWTAGQTSGHGALDNVSTVTWDAGPMVCAMGRGEPGDVVLIRFGDQLHERLPNEFGIWGFVHKTEKWFTGHVPELVHRLGR